jgi:carbonic anhydrase
MRSLKSLFDNNRAWAADINRAKPGFFDRLARQQTPEFLWIGCSDSRVPANEITGVLPGDVFVHRNIANVVVHTDLNCLSVIEFAVDLLKVRHIIVCGHYGCSGVHTAMTGRRVGLADNWLRHVQDVGERHEAYLGTLLQEERRYDALCELNVIEQVRNVCQTTVVREAWARGQPLDIHGWIYGIQDGLLRDLEATIISPEEVSPVLAAACERVRSGGPKP